MADDRVVSVDHSEIVQGVQAAMIDQLKRDGRLGPGMELGLFFYATTPDDLHVVGRVRKGPTVLHEMRGNKPQLSAITAGKALEKLPAEAQRLLDPSAEVHFRLIRFTCDDESVDRLMADVSFHPRPSSPS